MNTKKSFKVCTRATDDDLKKINSRKITNIPKDEMNMCDLWCSMVNDGYEILKQVDKHCPNGIYKDYVFTSNCESNYLLESLAAFRTQLKGEMDRVCEGSDPLSLSEGHYLHGAKIVQNKYNLYKKHYSELVKNILLSSNIESTNDFDRLMNNIRNKVTPIMHTVRNIINRNCGLMGGYTEDGMMGFHIEYVRNKNIEYNEESKDNTVDKKRAKKRAKKKKYNKKKKMRK